MKPQKGFVKKLNIEKDYLRAMGLSSDWRKKNKLPASFDHDGDRLIIKNFSGDVIGGIIADRITKRGDTIIYDLRCTHAIPEYFRNKGIKVISCRVGHYNIKNLMREKKAVFAMELSGHYYFKDFHYCEMPLYALKILNKETKSLKELAKPFTKYFNSGIINFPAKNGTVIEKLKEKYRNGAQSSLDGLTVEFSNWWFNLRPSKTESLIRLVIEANTKELLESKKKDLLHLL